MAGARQLTPALGLAIGVVLALGTTRVQARPRKVQSKGIQYTLELTPPDGSAPVRLCLDPGKEAWLAAAWGGGNRAAIRAGRGLKWNYIRDTREGVSEGFLFLEVEPLGSRSFRDEADRYRQRLHALWERSGATFERVTNDKTTSSMRICGQKVQGRRLLQEVREKRDGKLHGATSVLLPLHGHLVVLTGYGKWDPVPGALRALEGAPKSWSTKGHTYHCVDFVGAPQTATFVVLPLPVGYDVVPGSSDENDEDLVNRFQRNGEDSTPGTVTLRRLLLNPETTPQIAVGSWVDVRTALGIKCDEPQPFELDGNACPSVGYVGGDEAQGAPVRGWLVAWKSKCGVYALQWETTEVDPLVAERARAELLAALRELQTWHVQLRW